MSNLLTMDGSTNVDKDMAKDKEQGQGIEKEQRRVSRGGSGRREEKNIQEREKEYAKEATMIVNVAEVDGGKAEDVIVALIVKVGVTKVLAVRPRLNKEFEITLENESCCESLKDGLIIKGTQCEVRSLSTRECVVSFMHLPCYITDEEIKSKLNTWGVSATSGIRRRLYPGMSITDGTRYVRVKFPRDVTSLPYSTRFETAEGAQYFRVIHDRQVKICRLCMGPGHVMKDCPEFRCRDCGELGHFARECDAVRCPDCKKGLVKCECWMGAEGDEENNMETEETQSEEEEEEEQMEEREQDEGEQAGGTVGNEGRKEQEDENLAAKEEEQDALESQEEQDEMEEEQRGVNKQVGEKGTTRRRLLKVEQNHEQAKKRHVMIMETGNTEVKGGEWDQNRYETLSGRGDKVE